MSTKRRSALARPARPQTRRSTGRTIVVVLTSAVVGLAAAWVAAERPGTLFGLSHTLWTALGAGALSLLLLSTRRRTRAVVGAGLYALAAGLVLKAVAVASARYRGAESAGDLLAANQFLLSRVAAALAVAFLLVALGRLLSSAWGDCGTGASRGSIYNSRPAPGAGTVSHPATSLRWDRPSRHRDGFTDRRAPPRVRADGGPRTRRSVRAQAERNPHTRDL